MTSPPLLTAELVTADESAVLVPLPEAERVVSPHRARLDGAAGAVASVSAFGCEFPGTA